MIPITYSWGAIKYDVSLYLFISDIFLWLLIIMANTKKPELKEPGPSDNQLIDYKKSNVRFACFLLSEKYSFIYRKVNN